MASSSDVSGCVGDLPGSVIRRSSEVAAARTVFRAALQEGCVTQEWGLTPGPAGDLREKAVVYGANYRGYTR